MKKRKHKTLSKKDSHIKNCELMLHKNAQAQQQTTKYNFTIHDLKSVRPINQPQTTMFKSFIQGNHIVADGSAGTGKTYAAIFLALNELLQKDSSFQKIIIVRSAVASRDLGHLPGSADEKMEIYELPYIDMVNDMLGSSKGYSAMKEAGRIQFMPTSFVRGLTWDNAIVVVDEVQNLTFHEINSVMTRLGSGSTVMLCGDYIQSDLNKSRSDSTGIGKFVRVVQRIDDFDYIKFTTDDIVRSAFVKKWIQAIESDDE